MLKQTKEDINQHPFLYKSQMLRFDHKKLWLAYIQKAHVKSFSHKEFALEIVSYLKGRT